MDLLVTPNLVSNYIMNLNKINKNGEEKIINLIFENSNNKFIINKKLLECFEAEFQADSYEFVKFQDEMVNLLSSKGINKGTKEVDIKKILEETEKKYLKEKNCNEVYLNLSESDDISLKNKFSAILSEFSNPKSKDYTFFYLAAYNPISLTKRHYDFADEAEIKSFLDSIYGLKTTNELSIFDRNINLTHNYYNFFKNKGLKINYYTLKHRSFNLVEKKDQYTTLIRFFNRCSMFVFRAPHKIIHERRLMFNNIIIEFDNDPANILVSEPNWKIDVYVCNTIKNQMEIKGGDLFRRDYTT